MKKVPGTGVLIDLDAIGEIAGTVDGLAESLNSRGFLDYVSEEAHRKASLAFDVAVSAAAGAGYLTHVYEWGVAGITSGGGRGRTNFTDPLSPAARLWVHDMQGTGGSYEVDYMFRPAVAPNPKPTKMLTGVETKYLKMLSNRKYVFRNRAFVTETGAEVEIAPKEGRWLFVPFYGDPGPNGRGYMMWDAEAYGPIKARPGRSSKGTFTAFWEAFWHGEGIPMMEADVYEDIMSEVRYAISKAQARSAVVDPVPVAVAPAVLEKTKKQAKSKTSVPIKRKGNQKRRRR